MSDRPGQTPARVEQPLKDEFDQLCEEAAVRRRMMLLSTHDRVAGRPFRVRSLDRFLTYALSHPGVVCLRKDEIAAIALSDSATLREANSHDTRASWERSYGDQKIIPID